MLYVFSPLKVILVQRETGRAKRQFPPSCWGFVRSSFVSTSQQHCQGKLPLILLCSFSPGFFITRRVNETFSERQLTPLACPHHSGPRWSFLHAVRAVHAVHGLLCTGKAMPSPLLRTCVPSVSLHPNASIIPSPTAFCPAGGPTAWRGAPGHKWDPQSGDAHPEAVKDSTTTLAPSCPLCVLVGKRTLTFIRLPC